MALEKHMNFVRNSFLQREYKEREVWEGFDEEKEKLERVVYLVFNKTLEEIYLDGAKIEDFDVIYNPERNEFKIKISKLKLPDGRVMDDEDIFSSQYACPHDYLKPIISLWLWDEELHPKIRDFRKKYHVDYIQPPNNDCEHK